MPATSLHVATWRWTTYVGGSAAGKTVKSEHWLTARIHVIIPTTETTHYSADEILTPDGPTRFSEDVYTKRDFAMGREQHLQLFAHDSVSDDSAFASVWRSMASYAPRSLLVPGQ